MVRLTNKDIDFLITGINEDELFEDRKLYESKENLFALEYENIKSAIMAKGISKERIHDLEFKMHSEISDKIESIELEYQLVKEFLMVYLSKKYKIDSKIAYFLGKSFDLGRIPLIDEYDDRL